MYSLRKYTLDRWNWSEKAGKWVYVTEKKGRRNYIYQLDPPKAFIELTMEISRVNNQLIITEDPEENKKLFIDLIEISQKLQAMGKND